MKKRLFSLFLACLMLLSLFPSAAFATEAELMDPSGNQCGENATWTLENGVLTISGTGAMYDYANNAELSEEPLAPWTAQRNDIESVVIQSGVTSVGARAFYDCESVKSVEIPSGVLSIGQNAFSYCVSLKSVTLPDSVFSMGSGLFYGCAALENVEISSQMSSIPGGMFLYCEKLTKIRVPDNVTAIETAAFGMCSGLTEISLPAGLQSVGAQAFYGCDSLSTVNCRGTEAQWNAVTKGEDNAPLTSANIVFSGNGGQNAPASGNQCGENVTWTLENGVLTISGVGEMYDYPEYTPWYEGDAYLTVTSVIVEEGVTGIGMGAFAACFYLTSASIPESVTSIGYGAFLSTALERITIPGQNVTIGERAFYNCIYLEEVDVTGSVSSIGKEAFVVDQDYRDQNAYMPLRKVSFPGEGITIGDYAFSYCISLEDVSFPGTVSNIGDYAFGFCVSLDMSMPNGLVSVGDGAFYGCTSLKEARLPGSLLNLGLGAFYRCSALETVVLLWAIPVLNHEAQRVDELSEIKNSAFQGCSSLKSIVIPNSVKRIYPNAFDGCDSLETVYYSGTESQLGSIAVEDGNDPLIAADFNLNAPISYNLESEVVPLNEAVFRNHEFAIQLENNPFFPYEIQFAYQNETRTEWFLDENDSVTIGGYTFRVAFNGAARYLHFIAGGDAVPAYPNEKEFNNEGGGPLSAYASVTPLNVNLLGKFWSELKEVRLETPSGDSNVWYAQGRGYSTAWDAYIHMEDNFTFDFTAPDQYYYSMSVGKGTANSQDNAHYYVFVSIPSVTDTAETMPLLRFDLRNGNAGRDEIKIVSRTFSPIDGGGFYRLAEEDPNWDSADSAYLSIDYGTDELRNREGVNVIVYEGGYLSEENALNAGARIITDEIWQQSDMAHTGGYLNAYGGQLSEAPRITMVFKQGDTVLETLPLIIWVSESFIDLTYRDNYYMYSGNEVWKDCAAGFLERTNDSSINDEHFVFGLYDAKDSAQGAYYVGLQAYRTGLSVSDYQDDPNGLLQIRKAALGRWTTQEEFAHQEDIKERLFSDAQEMGKGYRADFGNGDVTFTIQDVLGDRLRYVTFTLRTYDKDAEVYPAPSVAYRQDSYFRLERALDGQNNPPRYAWLVDYRDDSYYYNGYQTVFQIFENPVEQGSTMYPQFYSNSAVTMYASADVRSGTEQVSGESPATLDYAKPVSYSAAVKDTEHLKNYWVTVVTPQSGGAKLFVNAATNIDDAHRDTTESDKNLPVREVFLNSAYDNHHDIMIANIGDEALTGLDVKLVGDLNDESVAAKNVHLDSAWKLGQGGVNSLAAFNAAAVAGKSRHGNGCDNMTKIRLLPGDASGVVQGAGEVSGYLIITSSNGGNMTVKLTGMVGQPKITTESLNTVNSHDYHAVKYVHYSTFLQTSSMYSFDRPSFSVVSGVLPKGVSGENLDVTLNPNGELYGVPEQIGDFTFTVRATFYGDESVYDEKTYTLRVVENTDENVNYGTGISDYPLFQSKPEDYTPGVEYDPDTGDLILHYDADFKLFVWRLTLDGKELTPGEDYTAKDGSTEATIRSQSIRTAGSGTHTISAENRAGGSSNVKTNLTRQSVNVPTKSAGSGNSNGGGGSSGGSGGSGGGSSGGGSGSSSGGGSSGGGSSSSGGSSGGGSSSSGRTTYYSVKTNKTSHGSISLSETKVVSGKTVTITVTPDKGYQVKSVSAIDNQKNALKLTNNGNKYTFSMPKRSVTVSATFELSIYNVSAAAEQHGKITLNTSSATPGATVNGSTTPDKGYQLSGVTVRDDSGKDVKVETFNDGKFTFLMPLGNATVRAEFTLKRLNGFQDIDGTNWFYDDAVWAYSYKDGILRGYSETEWRPSTSIHSVSVAVTLRRMDGADLTPYYTGADDGLDNSAWYVAAARWANVNGIFQPDVPFNGYMPMTRGEYAVILRNYLRYRGINVTPTEPVSFLDAEQMTADELDAFRVLREAGVFQGDSTGAMLPKSSLKRSHLAALLHRLSEYIIKTESAGEGT